MVNKVVKMMRTRPDRAESSSTSAARRMVIQPKRARLSPQWERLGERDSIYSIFLLSGMFALFYNTKSQSFINKCFILGTIAWALSMPSSSGTHVRGAHMPNRKLSNLSMRIVIMRSSHKMCSQSRSSGLGVCTVILNTLEYKLGPGNWD